MRSVISAPVITFALLISLVCGCTKTSEDSLSAAKNKSKTTQNLAIIAWNVESWKNEPNVIASQLTELSGYDIYCLSEVSARNFDKYLNALPDGYVSVSSKTGRTDRLQIIFNSNRFELLQQKELHDHEEHKLNNGTHRSPLFVRLMDKGTNTEFVVMTNHLARHNNALRKQQAIGLREWGRSQNVPIVNVGDFNMDYDFHTKQGNSAFPEIVRDNVWTWVQPQELIDTNWYDPDKDGKDNFPDSMLDFAFVAGAAKDWNPVCKVIVREGDFPDDDTTSDHRPIELILQIPQG